MVENDRDEKLDIISSYLQKKKEKEIQELKKKIEITRNEVHHLKKEVTVLELLKNDPSDFVSFALNQSGVTAAELEQIIENMFSENLEDEKKLIKDHDRKMAELSDKIQAGKEYAFDILNDIMNKEELPEKLSENYDEDNDEDKDKGESEIDQDLEVNDFNENEQFDQKNDENLNQEIKRTKIIQGFWDDDVNLPDSKEAKNYDNKNGNNDGDEIKEESTPEKSSSDQKYRYVLGKIAGSDLYDNSGKLIIAKDEIITPEITNKAEKEGKIIELVLEMKLSEG